MGESITEGTVSKWLKQVGDTIEKDEAILEISTDKVDAEVPSPGAGTLLEIRHQEGVTVEVGTVLAVIGAAGEQPQAASKQAAAAASPPAEPAPAAVDLEPPTPQPIAAQAQAAAAATSAPTGDATEVVMPQMGESITEGTVSKWLKSVGDNIEKDEPLLEISTDKVDAEVPSPAAGKLLSINVQEGETVEVGSVLALVGAEGAEFQVPSHKLQVPLRSRSRSQELRNQNLCRFRPPVCRSPPTGIRMEIRAVDELRRTKSSPLVRNIAKEHGVDITRIPGSGLSGRVTKNDILSFIETGAALRPQDLLRKDASLPTPKPAVAKPAFAPPQVRGNGRRPHRENVRDAKEDRGAHDVLEADLGARYERLRDRHDERGPFPRAPQR